MLEKLQPARTITAVTSQLEERILDGTFERGELLPSEEQLAAQLGVGRRSVREALKMLEARGLVEVRMGVGTTVKRNDLDTFLKLLTRNVNAYLVLNKADVQQIGQLREILEGAALERLSAHPDPAVLESLRNDLAGQRAALADGDPLTYQDCHQLFHRHIVDSLGNPVVSMIFQQVLQLVHGAMQAATRQPGVIRLAVDEHERILRALSSGEAQASRRMLRDHLDGFVAHLNELNASTGADHTETE